MAIGKELFFDRKDMIVSKTDQKGHIVYANDIFCRLSGFTEKEILGQPHNMIRHPEMPRCVFKLLWDTVSQGTEIFAYVVNSSKNGDYYWVLAHVTPSWGANGSVVGYHSTRRVPSNNVIQDTIIPLYRDLCAIERSVPNRKEGMQKSLDHLQSLLDSKGKDYDEFVAELSRAA